ncbi:LysE/ArgO family amino acid transporter [Tersicoccus sp. Bi-70]|uniref:LysE/ArgO family amino acid transporter n=1 Tax=Tersicoccus sp. Bi-70 TaxID=1897634 RepID=UPI0009789790|nr:LysE/ArgO family amino acid transporter [Tersicoccus sp. Bi-70]OMH36723.1 amino acid transporter [Tersicoccus sp. Bi-70]
MPFALATALAGLGTGLGLIIAIGAQNTFVLRQGIRHEHVAVLVGLCLVSDVVLIAAGVAGLGALVTAVPAVLTVVRIVGAAFLLAYAVLAARRALHPGRLTAEAGGGSLSRRRVLLTGAALTWLNPHVYLDTVLLVGSLAAVHGDTGRWWFGAGAMVASALWFVALGWGAGLLAGWFRRPATWRILDGAIAVVMAALGLRLLLGG